MFMSASDTALLVSHGFKGSPNSALIFYGTDKEGTEWQAEETKRGQLFFREVKNYRLGMPVQFSQEFFRKMY